MALKERNIQVEKAAMLLGTIIQNHFETSEDALKEDKFLAYEYESSYTQIQTLLFILDDYVLSIKKAMAELMDIDTARIIPNKTTA